MPSRQSRHSTLDWRTSKASGGSGECVEVANGEKSVLVRDSRNPSGAMLEFSPGQWSSFMRRVRAGNGNSVSL
jgi:Domain of unknown function (DUF397)